MTVKAILAELRSWRSRPSQRERLRSRPLDREHPDPTPVALPVGYESPPTMETLIAQYVRHEVSQQASAQGFGTFEEEDDFEDDDPEDLPWSEFELTEPMAPDPDMPDPGTLDPVEDSPPAAPAAPPAAAGNEGDEPKTDPSVLT